MTPQKTDVGHDPDHVPDRTLIHRTHRGDPASFDQLYTRHRPAVLRFARSLEGAAADDLVAEAFTRVLALVRRGAGPEDDLLPYLIRVVRNLHYDGLRRQFRTPQLSPHSRTALRPGMPSDSDLLETYARLPLRWQLVLWLRDVEKMPLKDAANLLELSPNAAAAVHFRARHGLRTARAEDAPS